MSINFVPEKDPAKYSRDWDLKNNLGTLSLSPQIQAMGGILITCQPTVFNSPLLNPENSDLRVLPGQIDSSQVIVTAGLDLRGTEVMYMLALPLLGPAADL